MSKGQRRGDNSDTQSSNSCRASQPNYTLDSQQGLGLLSTSSATSSSRQGSEARNPRVEPSISRYQGAAIHHFSNEFSNSDFRLWSETVLEPRRQSEVSVTQQKERPSVRVPIPYQASPLPVIRRVQSQPFVAAEQQVRRIPGPQHTQQPNMR